MNFKISKDPESPFIKVPKCSSLNANELLFAVQCNDHIRIKELISKNDDILSYQYAPYEYQTILQVACNDQHSMGEVTGATIETLIQFGARCNEPSKHDQWEAIHYTAVNANKEKMEIIIQNLSEDELNSLVTCSKQTLQKYPFCKKKIEKTYSNNALSVLLKYGNRDRNFHACCQLLVDKGIDVQQADSKGVTPSDLIWKFQDEKLNRLFKVKSVVQDNFKDSFGLLRLNSINRFTTMDITPEEANSLDGKNESVSSCTLLQMCCAKGLTACVRHLLDKGASPNKVIKKNLEHPILIAINGDHEEMVKAFLKRNDVILPDNILLKLQMLYNNKKKVPIVDKYMKMILKNLRRCKKETLQKYLQARDDLDRTALHYAVHYKCTNTIMTLLSMGASLISEDIFGYTPLHSIESYVLEKFFANCVSQEDDEPTGLLQVIQSKPQYSVKVNYENLVSSEKNVPESQFLHHMIHVTSLNHLMNHPVVASFLALKWDKLKWWVYLNLSFYCIAYASLLFDGFVLSKTERTSNTLLWIAYILLLCRDLSQLLIFRLSYITRAESVIDLSLISAVTYIIVDSWIPISDNKNLLVACSIVFLTSTIGIFNQLGNLSYFTVKVTMLREISANFLKAMAFYMFPVVAFFFCFYMLSETKSMFFTMLYDTVTMYAGDADADFPDQFERNPIFGHFIYLIFVVFIGIILHNLLIGLAVSDLQEIQKQAEFICKKEQAKYTVKTENIIFNQFKKSKFLEPMFQKLLDFLQVFKKNRVLDIQFYDSSSMYVKEDMGVKKIRDRETVTYLQHIFKQMTLNDKRTEDVYSLKSLHEKLEKLEAMVAESLGKTKNEKKETSFVSR